MARRVVVPRAVMTEVTSAREQAPGAAEVAAQPWFEFRDADAVKAALLLAHLGRSEAEALALAQDSPNALLLVDDLRARKPAQRLGLRRIGTVGLLARAKREGLIPRLKPALDSLVAHGIFVRQELLDSALKDAGE
jgi:predicted nucleic acid-binding protein